MKIRKILAAIAASAVAISALAVSSFAYDINKDLKTGWSVSTIVPAEEFEGATPDSVFTVTFEADASLAEKDGHNYWCIKTMVNDTGWPFITTLVGPTLSENKDTYAVSPDDTEMKFTIPADVLETLQTTGMAFMGHGVKLGTFSYSNSETLAPAADAEPAADVQPAADTTEETTPAATPATNGNPNTGVEDLVGLTAAALISGGVMVLSRKRK